MKLYFSFLLTLFICPLFSSGQRTIRVESKKEIEPIKTQLWVYHSDAANSEIHFKFSSSQLVYNKSESAEFTAMVQVSYRVWTLDNVKQVVDSGSVVISDTNIPGEEKDIYGKIKVVLPEGKNYQAKIIITDKKKNAFSEYNLFIDKKDTHSRQNFLLKQGDMVSCTQYMRSKEVSVSSLRNRDKAFFVRVYKRSFSLAPPPFSDYRFQQFRYEADSIYKITLNSEGVGTVILPESGFIHLVSDTAVKTGLSVFHFPKYFPRVMTPDALISPLRYICSSEEYKELTSASDKKKALDKFWLDRAGSKERARELIRNYYGRVEESNRRFSSYTEGWKTDRGMVYLIFGEPASIDRTSDSEIWIYGDRFSSTSLRFNFVKVNNPFTDNDYFLQRMPAYKPEWYKAVDTWRSGRVYYFLN